MTRVVNSSGNLTQKEIKSLLELSRDNNDLDSLASSPIVADKNYTTYDFLNPFTISKEQDQAFSKLHIAMIRSIGEELSANLRKKAYIEIQSIEQMSYGEYILNVANITSFATVSILPLEGILHIETELLISQKIISELLGNGDSFNPAKTKENLTEIEISVLEYFFQLIVKNMENSWDSIMGINFTLKEIELNAKNSHTVAPHELCLLVVSNLKIDDVSGNVAICYPVLYIKSLLDKITKITEDNTFNKASRKQDFNVLMAGSRMQVDAIMAESFLRVQDILKLKADDIIMFNKNATSSSGKIQINHKEKFSGLIGELNNKKAIQIQESSDKEHSKTLGKLKNIYNQRLKDDATQEQIRKNLIRDKLQKKIDSSARKSSI
jgi:flagellar motor switch protein FliM